MKRVILLGSSGSIGESTCKVARQLPDQMKLVGLAVSSSTHKLLEQAKEFQPEAVAVYQEDKLNDITGELPNSCRLYSGAQGLVDLVKETDAEMVLVAIVGTAGLEPALIALETGKDLAVASKEILVMAGERVTSTAKKYDRAILPVDSEHNAIFQCLESHKTNQVRRLILTASGGPFRLLPKNDFNDITLAQALKHPTWNMGQKITIDSATMFNKGLEMIEARWLFDVEMARIDVLVHPQSIVHSMVEYIDHSILAQLSHSDMCFPIQYAVTYPDRYANNLRPLDFAELGQLLFEAPDPDKFPALRLAREAGEAGGTLPAVLNAANEVAVDYFLKEDARFPQIWHTVESVMQEHDNIASPDLDAIISADSWARRRAQAIYQELAAI
ncbi:MAG: 1-deoxy-D-xylulose-5-phosphate reductoisomerase [Verrucomicrobiota bacterium]